MINKNEYIKILQYCAGEINKVFNGRLLMSRPVRNRVKCIIFDLFNTKYGNVFKRPNLPSEFKAFAVATKKSIWRHIMINRYGGVEVTMADTI